MTVTSMTSENVITLKVSLVFDFTDVSYVSSAGLRELLVCRK